jgi:glycosyltransferase involved in cell wall biosynthesis
MRAVRDESLHYKAWLTSKEYWDFIVFYYETKYIKADFSEYFWAAHGIFSSFLDTVALANQLPKADVYHSLTTGSSGFLGCLGKVKYRRPFLVSEHGLYMKERLLDLTKQDVTPEVKQQIVNYYKSLVQTCYQEADYLIPVCNDHAKREIEQGVNTDKIKVVINGVDADKFTPLFTNQSRTPVVGCFARVVPVKDQLSLIRASKNVLGKHDADFIFAGEIQDQDYYEECRALVSSLGIDDNIKFIGHSDNMLDLYHQTDIFVLSSESEGVPLALLEAMSCGVPAVCTGVGGVPEIIADTETGYLVKHGDITAMSNRISTLLGDDELRKSMGIKARASVLKNYTIEKMSQKIFDIYTEVCAKETE